MAYKILNYPVRFGVWLYRGKCECGCEFECEEADLVPGTAATTVASKSAVCPLCHQPVYPLTGLYYGQQSTWRAAADDLVDKPAE